LDFFSSFVAEAVLVLLPSSFFVSDADLSPDNVELVVPGVELLVSP